MAGLGRSHRVGGAIARWGRLADYLHSLHTACPPVRVLSRRLSTRCRSCRDLYTSLRARQGLSRLLPTPTPHLMRQSPLTSSLRSLRSNRYLPPLNAELARCLGVWLIEIASTRSNLAGTRRQTRWRCCWRGRWRCW